MADFDFSPVQTSSSASEEPAVHPSYVCWTRMQAESGQTLGSIIQPKECERRYGDGHFCWGVSNAPALAISPLARQRTPVPAIFSEMESKPRPADTHPAQVVAWRPYLDFDGTERPLPDHVLVTSKATITRTMKLRSHYALMCFTDSPLELADGAARFDHPAYRNVSNQCAPVGPSQVTALLQLTDPGDANPTNLTTSYQADLQAWLTGSYWVRLCDPVLPRPEQLVALRRTSGLEARDWFDIVATIHDSEPFPIDHVESQSTLFSQLALADVT